MQPKDEPLLALADRISRAVQLVRRAPFPHCLINDELNDVGTEESRARVSNMNLDLVDYYRQMLRADGGRELAGVNSCFDFRDASIRFKVGNQNLGSVAIPAATRRNRSIRRATKTRS